MTYRTELIKFTNRLPILVAIMATVWFGAANMMGAMGLQWGTAPEQSDHARPPAIGSPADLAQRHGCWAGEAPADMKGKFPGHVVVTAEGKAPRYAGPAMVSKALQQTFDGVDHGLTVHAYCR